MAYKVLAHSKKDHVGVAIDEIREGETVEGFFLEDGSTIVVNAIQNIPIGHKISLAPVSEGAGVNKYGEIIGKATVAIQIGEHVHVHNLVSGYQD